MINEALEKSLVAMVRETIKHGATADEIRRTVEQAIVLACPEEASCVKLLDQYRDCFVSSDMSVVAARYIELYMSNLIDAARGSEQ